MKIQFVEIQNFRKLKSTHIDFGDKTTLFVGANNSGKTSAMLALRYFLVDQTQFSIRDFTISNWEPLNDLGRAWEDDPHTPPTLDDLARILPAMDVWFNVQDNEIHHVVHLLPTLDWSGGLLGVRLRYEPKDLDQFKKEYRKERKASARTVDAASAAAHTNKLSIWPSCMHDFLERRLSSIFGIKAYALDPARRDKPNNGVAQPQRLPLESVPIEGDPFKKLIRIDEIAAQREFSDAGDKGAQSSDSNREDRSPRRYKRKLSEQLRAYYNKHLDPFKAPTDSDADALNAIQMAEESFDQKLEDGFAVAISELEALGYPGVTDPKLKIKTQLRATDGLRHGSAVQYEVASSSGSTSTPLRLPEDYSGLGYQNLISMVFMLMSFRDDWMRVGKAASDPSEPRELQSLAPLHLVLVEEPEAHLHAQVQQVFINKAYSLLRNRPKLKENALLSTRLIVSTHSSHIAHEADFQCLRYFRRRPPNAQLNVPTTTVADLSVVFGKEDATQRFVSRYLKVTHCDLFFADAAILVEGQAERILVPHFIRYHFKELSRRYVTLLEIGGSHAHRFRPLIEELGLTTLIVGDLDSVERSEDNGTMQSKKPSCGRGQETRNPVLLKWHPAEPSIDRLLKRSPPSHAKTDDPEFSIYVAYQKPLTIQGENGAASQQVTPRTFEDALVFDNLLLIKKLHGCATTNKISAAVEVMTSLEQLTDKLFDILKSAEKAAFALDLLMEDPEKLKPPSYVHDGLKWLDDELERRRPDVLPAAEKKGS